jgi:hypothetical protein
MAPLTKPARGQETHRGASSLQAASKSSAVCHCAILRNVRIVGKIMSNCPAS